MKFQRFTSPYITEKDIGHVFSAGQTICEHWKAAMEYEGRKKVELIFEEVRLKEYPALPSRKNCLYLFDPNLDPTMYASSIGFLIEQSNLFEVEIVNAHAIARVNKSLIGHRINSDGEINATDDELFADARQYWEGIDHSDVNEEVLFCGEFRYTRIISKSKFYETISRSMTNGQLTTRLNESTEQ